MISDRPPEIEDRAVPGHWEGDLIIGSTSTKSAIGTLVERTSGYLMLLHLPGDHTARTVAGAMIAAMNTLPEQLRRSVTWDQGAEMSRHQEITMATGMPIYFCDPHSPWQRGSNENTNGLLREYFPKGTDLSFQGPGILENVAAELNHRPRKRHGYLTPAEVLATLISNPSNQNRCCRHRLNPPVSKRMGYETAGQLQSLVESARCAPPNDHRMPPKSAESHRPGGRSSAEIRRASCGIAGRRRRRRRTTGSPGGLADFADRARAHADAIIERSWEPDVLSANGETPGRYVDAPGAPASLRPHATPWRSECC